MRGRSLIFNNLCKSAPDRLKTVIRFSNFTHLSDSTFAANGEHFLLVPNTDRLRIRISAATVTLTPGTRKILPHAHYIRVI
jgi:hypothetical protein